MPPAAEGVRADSASVATPPKSSLDGAKAGVGLRKEGRKEGIERVERIKEGRRLFLTHRRGDGKSER